MVNEKAISMPRRNVGRSAQSKSKSPLKRPALGWALAAVCGLGAALPIPRDAIAQEYPTRNIELVVPYPAGSSTDVIMRIFVDPLNASLGKPLVMNNIPGAGGIVGTERIARQRPDGYTIGIASSPHATI